MFRLQNLHKWNRTLVLCLLFKRFWFFSLSSPYCNVCLHISPFFCSFSPSQSFSFSCPHPFKFWKYTSISISPAYRWSSLTARIKCKLWIIILTYQTAILLKYVWSIYIFAVTMTLHQTYLSAPSLRFIFK